VQAYSSSAPKNLPLNLLEPALVDANRRGEVLPAQAAWLKPMPWGGLNRLSRVGVGIAIGLGAFLFVLFAFSTNLNTGFILIMGLVIAGLLAVMFVPKIVRSLRDSTNLGNDLQGGLVRQTAGELGFGKGGYELRAADQTLSLPPSPNACGLLPGLRYTVYFLEGSRFALSAEQLGDGSPGAVSQALTRILAEANGYAAEDLQANRNGEVSPGQRNRLLKKAISGGGTTLFGIIFAMALFLPSLTQGRLPQDLTSLAIPLAMVAYFLVSGGIALYKALADALSGTVESVQGLATKSSEQRSSGRSRRRVYLYNIGNEKFEVLRSAHAALLDGLEYRAFFAPRTRQLLSLELLDLPGVSFFGA